MKTALIVQARMTSTRLPGKVLKPVLGQPLLTHLIERLRRVEGADALVIATTTNATDEPIVALCDTLGVTVWRGSESDVLARYYDAARAAGADAVVRVTSDCPLIDPAVIDRAIALYRTASADYVSNTLNRTYPRGQDVEVFSFKALAEARAEAVDPPEREHVTPFLYRRPERYRLQQFVQEPDMAEERWTVDTPEDFELIRRVLEALLPEHPRFTLADVRHLLDRHPDWRQINATVEQKTL